MAMTANIDQSHDVYDPDDIGLHCSPRLKALEPKLQPTPSPPPDICEDGDGKTVPLQGDAVLISLLGNGKASEIARTAATELLAIDDPTSDVSEEDRDMSAKTARKCHSNELEALAAGVLTHFRLLTAHAATARVIPAKEPPRGLQALHSLTEHGCNTSAQMLPATAIGPPHDRLVSLLISNAKGDKLASISEPSANFESRVHELLNPTPDADEDTIPTDLPTISQSPPQPSAAFPGNQQIPPSSPINNPCRKMPPGKRGFQCTHPGCIAGPFATQYLLDSHKNVHSTDRPYYCPIKGCSRGKSSEGFKRKNEMIRHGLTHNSPGYPCPYCADGHKYLRPDSLQRHVKAHHPDKGKHDPRIVDALAKQPEGRSRERKADRENGWKALPNGDTARPFFTEDGKSDTLTVGNLLELNLRERSPFLAYLSACGTGRIKSEKFIDESMHLISACQLAGYRHVIGTLWEVKDKICVEMARKTYKGIRDRGMTDESVSWGLHKAARELRVLA